VERHADQDGEVVPGELALAGEFVDEVIVTWLGEDGCGPTANRPLRELEWGRVGRRSMVSAVGLNIDTSRLLLRPSELVALVRTVNAAHSEDEHLSLVSALRGSESSDGKITEAVRGCV
jgi:hypothetical protein